MLADEDISLIVGVLNYGPFDWHKRKTLIILQTVLTLIMLVALACIITWLSIEHIASQDPNTPFIIIIILLGTIFLLLPTITLVFVLRNEKMRKKIQLCMKDAVVVKAKSYTMDEEYDFPTYTKSTKIVIRFKIDGKKYQRQSRNLYSITDKEGGFFRLWRNYADRDITIAYSPKYDEVMILDDKKVNQTK